MALAFAMDCSQQALGPSQESESCRKTGKKKRGVKTSASSSSPSNPGWHEVMYKRGVEKTMSKALEDMYFVRKEKEELKECTFSPKISKASRLDV